MFANVSRSPAVSPVAPISITVSLVACSITCTVGPPSLADETVTSETTMAAAAIAAEASITIHLLRMTHLPSLAAHADEATEVWPSVPARGKSRDVRLRVGRPQEKDEGRKRFDLGGALYERTSEREHGVRVVTERRTAGREEQLGGERDLELLYRDAAPQLWRAIYGFAGGRRHLAEDAVAEAFARALEHERQIREPLAWIYRTAFRIASRELQREKRRSPAMPDPVPGIDPGEIQDVIRALAELSPNQRAAVVLHDQEGFTGPEVGRLLGISAATARVHMFRGRRRLRELLGDEEDIDG